MVAILPYESSFGLFIQNTGGSFPALRRLKRKRGTGSRSTMSVRSVQLRPLRYEMLEDRRLLTVDLSQFASFLPGAINAIQNQGVDAQIYKAPLPLIGNLLGSSSSPAAIQVLIPVEQNIQLALQGLIANPTQAVFEQAINAQLQAANVLITGVTAAAGSADPSLPSTTAVEYQFTVGISQADALTSNVKLDSKLGLAGLGIDLSQSVTASLQVWYTDTVAFGVDNGVFYIDASNSNLALYVNVAVASGTTFQGSVGLLKFSATSQAGTDGAGTGVQMAYTANLVGPSNNQLTQADLNNGIDYDASAILTANINLHLTAQFGGSTIDPSVQTDFVLAWTTTGDPTAGSLVGFSNTAPQTVEFDNVQIGVQNFFQEFAGPILQQIDSVTAPLEPIVSALQQEPLSKLGFDLTYEQILEEFLGISSSQMSYFDAVANLVTLVNAAESAANSSTGLMINLGSFNLADPRGSTAAIASSSPNDGAMNELASDDSGFASALSMENDGTATGLADQFPQGSVTPLRPVRRRSRHDSRHVFAAHFASRRV